MLTNARLGIAIDRSATVLSVRCIYALALANLAFRLDSTVLMSHVVSVTELYNLLLFARIIQTVLSVRRLLARVPL